MKKRALSLLLASIMLVNCLTGCGKNNNDSNKNDGQNQVVQNSQQESQTDSQVRTDSEAESEKESEVEMTPEQKWYNSAESNGYGFSVSNQCLNDYLEYVVSEKAISDYRKAIATKEKAYSDIYSGYLKINIADEKTVKPAYFSIVGSQSGGEPFLLVSFENTSRTDGIVALEYEYNSGKIFSEFCRFFDTYEARGPIIMQWDILAEQVGTLYVYTTKGKAQFLEQVKIDDEISKHTWYFHYDWKSWWVEEDYAWEDDVVEIEDEKASKENYTTSRLESNKIAEIKWFGIDEIDKAKAYYSQFLKEDITIKNRHDYFTDDSCVLSLYKEFDDGELYIEEDKNMKKFVLQGVSGNRLSEIYRDSNGAVYTFEGWVSSSGSIFIDIFKMQDGSYRIASKEITAKDGKGTIVKFYEVDESYAMNIYGSGNKEYGDVKTFDELLKVLEENK